jgi:hypothetical protein
MKNRNLRSSRSDIDLMGSKRRRGRQVVRHGSAKAAFVGSIPTLASNSKLLKSNELQTPEEASASESASEISTTVKLKYSIGYYHPSLGWREWRRG